MPAGEPDLMGGVRLRQRAIRRRRAWIIAVAALALIGFLYYRPVQAYVRAQDALQERAAEVRHLKVERTELRRRLALDGTGAPLVREARRLGLVRPDERLYIVKGTDAWRRARAAERAGE